MHAVSLMHACLCAAPCSGQRTRMHMSIGTAGRAQPGSGMEAYISIAGCLLGSARRNDVRPSTPMAEPRFDRPTENPDRVPTESRQSPDSPTVVNRQSPDRARQSSGLISTVTMLVLCQAVSSCQSTDRQTDTPTDRHTDRPCQSHHG